MQRRRRTGSRFSVDLGGVKLPDIVEKRIEAEIQAVVLRVLADTDFRDSDLSALTPFNDWVIQELPEGTAGMILEPPDDDDDDGDSQDNQ
jgi:hypothetical protein